MQDHSIDLCQQRLLLLPERALYWPARKILFIADAHFGKAAAFRAHGVPVPHGTTAANLARLDDILLRHAIERIVFLGDFLHAKHGREERTLAAIEAWRLKHGAVAMTLVRGNHDRHAGDPPASFNFEVVNEPLRLGPFAFSHEPAEVSGAYAIAGHLHPTHVLYGRANEKLRLPCFWFRARCAVLPAFGAFTGGFEIEPQTGDRLYLVAEDRVLSATR